MYASRVQDVTHKCHFGLAEHEFVPAERDAILAATLEDVDDSPHVLGGRCRGAQRVVDHRVRICDVAEGVLRPSLVLV